MIEGEATLAVRASRVRSRPAAIIRVTEAGGRSSRAYRPRGCRRAWCTRRLLVRPTVAGATRVIGRADHRISEPAKSLASRKRPSHEE